MCTLIKKQAVFAPILLLWLVARGVSAGSISVLVTDSTGAPLRDAVVELLSPTREMAVPNNALIVDQVDKAFSPKVLVAPVNSYVNFPNSDQIRHHVYSFSEAKTFELKLYAGEPKAPLLFNKTGVVVLGCNIHDSMVGYIYVAGSQAQRTGQDGIAKFNSDSTDVMSFTVWHPDAKGGITSRKPVSLSTDSSKTVTVSIPISPPEPRNTFEDVFGLY